MIARRVCSVVAGALAGAVACSEPTAPPLPLVASAGRIIAGESTACALATNGAVHCWGANTPHWEYGRDPAEAPGLVVPSITSVPKLAQLATGVAQHMCGISALGDAICWGRGTFGQLGNGTLGATGNAPVYVLGNTVWSELSVGRLTTCGVSITGGGYCWGHNQSGEVGSSAVAIGTLSAAPVAVEGGHVFKSIGAGWTHACGLTTDGDAWCWGSNARGQLGIDTSDALAHQTPLAVTGGHKFRQLSVGSRYACGLRTDSTAYCWGDNSTGQLGDNSVTHRDTPVSVSGGLKFLHIVASSGFGAGAIVVSPVVAGSAGHTCAIALDNTTYCWGWNASGELGDGTTIDRLIPTKSSQTRFTTLVAGGAYTCGMNGDRAWCWGSNLYGQLGTGLVVSHSTSTRAVGPPFGQQ